MNGRAITRWPYSGWLLGLTFVGLARAEDIDAPLVHVLVVADTNDVRIGEHVKGDRGSVVGAVEEAIPAHRRTLRVLQGDDATPQNVLHYYRELQNGPNDTLLFYYAGHGAVDDDWGHVLTMQTANLSRRTLINTIKGKRARLNVILTDCCSVFDNCEQAYRIIGRVPETPGCDPRTARYLFFRHQGMVDLTAADIGRPAYGSLHGGCFTNALLGLLTHWPDELDTNGDGVPAWQDLWTRFRTAVQERSEAILETRDRRLTALVGPNPQFQVPHAFSELAVPVGGKVPASQSRFGAGVMPAPQGGARIVKVFDDSPAAWFGLQVGDVVTKLDRTQVRSVSDFGRALANIPKGSRRAIAYEVRRPDGTDATGRLRLAY